MSGTPRLRFAGLASTGLDERSADSGSGRTPRNGAGESATVAADSPRPARICASRPPNEWPPPTGLRSSRPMTDSKWSATWPTVLRANTSGGALASSTVSGSAGHPGVSAVGPASSTTAAHRAQLLGSSQSPWTKITGVRPAAFARVICSPSCAVIEGMESPVMRSSLAAVGPAGRMSPGIARSRGEGRRPRGNGYALDARRRYPTARRRRKRAPSAAAHEPPDRGHELLGAVVLLRLGALDHAVAGVVVEEAERDLVERRLDGGDLGQDVDAVAVVLDHPLHAAHLPLDAPQALEQLVLGRAVAARSGGGHGDDYTPSGCASAAVGHGAAQRTTVPPGVRCTRYRGRRCGPPARRPGRRSRRAACGCRRAARGRPAVPRPCVARR